jgi:hypothetical protein
VPPDQEAARRGRHHRPIIVVRRNGDEGWQRVAVTYACLVPITTASTTRELSATLYATLRMQLFSDAGFDLMGRPIRQFRPRGSAAFTPYLVVASRCRCALALIRSQTVCCASVVAYAAAVPWFFRSLTARATSWRPPGSQIPYRRPTRLGRCRRRCSRR